MRVDVVRELCFHPFCRLLSVDVLANLFSAFLLQQSHCIGIEGPDGLVFVRVTRLKSPRKSLLCPLRDAPYHLT